MHFSNLPTSTLVLGLALGTMLPTSGIIAADATVGLGIGLAPDYEGSDDYEAVPLWNLRLDNLYHPETFVQVLGPRLRSNLLPSDHWRFGISGLYIGKRDDVDDDRVDDLEHVDAGFFLGVVGGYDFLAERNRDLLIELDARQDVVEGNGFLGTVRAIYAGTIAPKWRFSTTLDTTWASEDYMSAYFGVSSADAASSGLDQFDADAGLKDVGLGAGVTYRPTQNWSATLSARYDRLLNDAEDSPIVDDRGSPDQFFTGLLVSYRF